MPLRWPLLSNEMYLVHDADGRPRHTIESCPEGTSEMLDERGEAHVLCEIAPINSIYVLNGEAVPRPGMNVGVSATTISVGDACVLSNLPIGAVVSVDGQPVATQTTSTLELEPDTPGVYKVLVVLWPYLDHKFNLEVAS